MIKAIILDRELGRLYTLSSRNRSAIKGQDTTKVELLFT